MAHSDKGKLLDAPADSPTLTGSDEEAASRSAVPTPSSQMSTGANAAAQPAAADDGSSHGDVSLAVGADDGPKAQQGQSAHTTASSAEPKAASLAAVDGKKRPDAPSTPSGRTAVDGAGGGAAAASVGGDESAGDAAFHEKWLHKGNVSNLVSLVIVLLGVIIRAASDKGSAGDEAARYVLTTGVFGIAGGVTNWLAIKMLFDQIPFLYGSGVIPRRFKEIRETVKRTIMKTFFDSDYLERYMKQKTEEFDIEGKLAALMQNPATHAMIDEKLTESFAKPEVAMLVAMMGLQPATLQPLLKPLVISMGQGMGPLIKQHLIQGGGDGAGSFIMDTEKLRTQLDDLMTSKLELLTPEIVKGLMEEVMRKHLGWLIVWGNVFGALIGVLSALIDFL